MWISAARGDWRLRSMATSEWQFRHSRLSLAFSRDHSRFAMTNRCSRNFWRVSMVPKILPQTSFDACILRAILSVHSCGTWQSGHPALTPDRLEKWTVCDSSSKTLSRISWQETQKSSVLVYSSAVLKPPQKITPPMNPPKVRNPSPSVPAGVHKTSQNQRKGASIQRMSLTPSA